MQILYQIAGISSGAAWSFSVTIIILKLLIQIPFIDLRVCEKEEAR